MQTIEIISEKSEYENKQQAREPGSKISQESKATVEPLWRRFSMWLDQMASNLFHWFLKLRLIAFAIHWIKAVKNWPKRVQRQRRQMRQVFSRLRRLEQKQDKMSANLEGMFCEVAVVKDRVERVENTQAEEGAKMCELGERVAVVEAMPHQRERTATIVAAPHQPSQKSPAILLLLLVAIVGWGLWFFQLTR